MSKLERFRAEVTTLGGEACLPPNLSDKWLDVVSRAMEALAPGDEEDTLLYEADPEELAAIGLAAVVAILRAKQGQPSSVEFSLGQMQEYFRFYRLELALETVNRCTDIRYEPATLKTIFTDRDVRTWREPRR